MSIATMAKIPFQAPQVGVGTPRAPRASMQDAQATGRAIAQMGQTIGQAGAQVAGAIKDRDNARLAIEAEKNRVEGKLLEQEIGGKLTVNQMAYNSEVTSGVRVDYNSMGTETDESLTSMADEDALTLSDPRLDGHPELKAKLMLDAEHNYNISSVKGKMAGLKALKDQGLATVNTNVDYAVVAGNYTLGLDVIEDARGSLMSNQEADDAIKTLAPRVARSSFDKQYESDPANALKELKEGVYDTVTTGFDDDGNPITISSNLSSEDKRSMKAYAKSALSDNQIDASNQMAMPDSDYSKLPPEGKLEWLDGQVLKKNISTNTYKTQKDLVKVPRYIDQTTVHRSFLLDTNMELRRAGGDKEKISAILDKVGTEFIPQEFQRELNELGTGLLDPNSKYNSSRFTHARDQLQSAFKQEDALPSETGFGIVGRGASKVVETFGFEPFATPRGFGEQRDALEINAQFEAEEAVNEWLETDGAEASIPEVTKFVSQTVMSIREKYGIPLLPERMAEVIQGEVAVEQAQEQAPSEQAPTTGSTEFEIGYEHTDENGTTATWNGTIWEVK